MSITNTYYLKIWHRNTKRIKYKSCYVVFNIKIMLHIPSFYTVFLFFNGFITIANLIFCGLFHLPEDSDYFTRRSAIVNRKKVKMHLLQRHNEMKFFLFGKSQNPSYLARTCQGFERINFLSWRGHNEKGVKCKITRTAIARGNCDATIAVVINLLLTVLWPIVLKWR